MHGRNRRTRVAVALAGATAAVVTAMTAGAAPATADATGPDGSAKPVVQTAPRTAAAGERQGDGRTAAADVDYETWKRDVSAVTDEARPYLEDRIDKGSGEKMAVVLDIDNTSLETGFHPIWEYPTPPVEQTLELARYADSRGVAVYFVTARPGIIYSLTEHNLKEAGFPIAGLYVRDLPDIFDEVSKYKTAKRAEIEAKGFTIIANIGNTPTDMVGGHAEKTFKLPDYDGELS
ncbi:HAD superfamily, subfamily IIIB (Acid phosphatase) [Streptomyces sp. WMMB 714]|uniref:HAD family acid phosphatase n=1 Tax=Streptomyces sp. WMMB 714 TaxID=1286822 RepID=UPI0005F78651|nr:HAD family acid phosphatase [Streptomyces sp. WMMB 714]SCK47566.1 HAD superfamily, subfamily IIIB (Acid phosphatase) [Streptomyces sp. WMMB 714]